MHRQSHQSGPSTANRARPSLRRAQRVKLTASERGPGCRCAHWQPQVSNPRSCHQCVVHVRRLAYPIALESHRRRARAPASLASSRVGIHKINAVLGARLTLIRLRPGRAAPFQARASPEPLASSPAADQGSPERPELSRPLKIAQSGRTTQKRARRHLAFARYTAWQANGSHPAEEG